MWIVRIALTRPYTFIVAALVIVLMTPIVLQRTPTDVFPNIDIPVVSVCWNYSGLSPQLMEDRIVSPYERFMTTVVDNIEHTESQTVAGRSIIKVFFQPGADVHVAVTQITAISQTMIRQLPPGISPPLIITYSASSVPVLQLGMRGQGLSEQELFDFGANLVRNQLATVAGAAIPWPYGGKQRQVSVNLDIPALQAKGLSPVDVINCHLHAESGAAFRHGQDGFDRIQRGDERVAGYPRRAEQFADQDQRTARRSMCGTSPTSATAFRRRSISRAWTASAA